MNLADRNPHARARRRLPLALLLCVGAGLLAATSGFAAAPDAACQPVVGGVAFSRPDAAETVSVASLQPQTVPPPAVGQAFFSPAAETPWPARADAGQPSSMPREPGIAFSAPVAGDGRKELGRVQPVASPVAFSELPLGTPAGSSAHGDSLPPVAQPNLSGFAFTAPSGLFAGDASPGGVSAVDFHPPVAFSSAAEVPYAASWAYLLQDVDVNRGSSTSERDPQTLGEEPAETTDSVQFLRQDTILLRPGQYQFDLTLQYLLDEADFTMARITDLGGLQLSELNRRQRLLLMPLEFRIGVTPISQFFVNVPLGWANGEAVYFSQDEISNMGGVGDISLGFVQQLARASEYFPNLLATVAVSAPTGNSDFADSLATPGSTLGQGCWTATWALTFTKAFDPVVLFGGVGYQWRTDTTFDTVLGRLGVDPGDQAFYRFGVGFAVNPKITFSAAFRGAYVSDNRVNEIRIPGSGREPMQMRLAATIVRDKKSRRDTIKTVEPFVDFGLTEGAIDSIFGVGWTF